MDPGPLLTGIERDLASVASPERAGGEKRYLKSDLEFLGATVPEIRRIAKHVKRAHPGLDRDSLLEVVGRLWARPVHEMRAMAVELLDLYADRLEAADITLLERLLRESRTWALVDNLAASIVGPLVERLPELNPVLDRWAQDEEFWIRRAALLALLLPLRAGRGDFERFGRYADPMLKEKEFFIRKAIGWVLRDTSRRRPELVAAWVGPRTHRMSGVTIREAIKRLPPEQAAGFLAAYKEGRPALPA